MQELFNYFFRASDCGFVAFRNAAKEDQCSPARNQLCNALVWLTVHDWVNNLSAGLHRKTSGTYDGGSG